MFGKKALAVLAGALVVIASTQVAPTSTTAKPARTPVFWVDLAGTAKPHPKFIFFTANSGGQVHSLKWTSWGKRRAVGKGIYHDSSPAFPGKVNREGPAKIVAWKPIACVPAFGNRKGRKSLVYRFARMKQKNGKGRTRWVDISDYTGHLACK